MAWNATGRARVAAALLALWCLSPGSAQAVSIASKTETTPFAGVVLWEGRTASPATDFKAAFISLCNDYVHMEASQAGSSRSSSSWGQAAGVQLAVNGDFYAFANGTSHVYGDAVGAGVRWPSIRTGRDPAYDGSWFYQRYGWIAFGNGWVEFSNTRRTKREREALGAAEGWHPQAVTTDIPPGTRALVSGFPQLVIEGVAQSCSSPTDSACFPDRSDMRARHPRTAMGLTEDRKTFLLVTVDGRSSRSTGMYGTELAALMKLLGSHVAFNLDGGGSTQMWVRGRGTINTPSDGSPRAVLNHWGVYAGAASGKPQLPGSCDESWEEVLHQSHIWGGPASSDVDGDGLADACSRSPVGVECYAGAAAVGRRLPGPELLGASGWDDPANFTTLRMGDLNGDGRADLCARANARMVCWLSDGQGLATTAIDGPEWSEAAGWKAFKYNSTIRMGDMTGDGRADLCARTAEGWVCHASTGQGFGAPIAGPAMTDRNGWGTASSYGTIRMADFNGDGRQDLCARNRTVMRCWASNGQGYDEGFDGPAWGDDTGWARVSQWGTIRMGDIDGDGRDDLCGRLAEGVVCHLSTGQGFGPAIATDALSDASGGSRHEYFSTLRLADVDGNGSRDLCYRIASGLECRLWNGQGFGRTITGPLSDASGWNKAKHLRTIQFADINGDGRADVCARAVARQYCWLSDGNGFPTRVDGPEWSDDRGWDAAPYYASIRVADPVAAPCVAPACGGPDPGPGPDAGPGTGASDVGVTDAGVADAGASSAPDAGNWLPSDAGATPRDVAVGPGGGGAAAEPDTQQGGAPEQDAAALPGGRQRMAMTGAAGCGCGTAGGSTTVPTTLLGALLGLAVGRGVARRRRRERT